MSMEISPCIVWHIWYNMYAMYARTKTFTNKDGSKELIFKR